MPDRPPSLPPPRTVARQLLTWFRTEQRDLPFRASKDPYSVWVSEVMLQQTTVAAVLPYYERWMRRFPTIRDLAAATEREVLESFAGLGYYARARRLHAAACFLTRHHDGQCPRSVAELMKLPGVGSYTAAAIASIAFELPEPALDTNAARVLARLCACTTPLAEPGTKGTLRTYAEQLLEIARPSEINQGLMELGALVCIAKDPSCRDCPLGRSCRARARGLVASIPVLSSRPPPLRLRSVTLAIEHRERLLVLAPDTRARHWAGLFTLPYRVLDAKEEGRRAGLALLRAHLGRVSVSRLPQPVLIDYAITRYRFRCEVYHLVAKRAPIHPVRGHFVPRSELAHLPLPAPHRRIILGLT